MSLLQENYKFDYGFLKQKGCEIMKRDLDLIRDILIFIEKNAKFNENLYLQNFEVLNRPYDEIAYQLQLLSDVGFIESKEIRAVGVYDCFIKRMTMHGHEYLDSIRNETIWNKTKEKLADIGGNAPLAIIQELAAGITRAVLGI